MHIFSSLSTLYDRVGNPYLGVHIDSSQTFVKEAIQQLQDAGVPQAWFDNQQTRDCQHHHITVVNAMEYARLEKEGTLPHMEGPILCEMLGPGRVQKEIKGIPHSAYFLVMASEPLQSVRALAGLKPMHFHMTLAFNPKDLHGPDIDKSRNSLLTLLDNNISLGNW